MPFDVQKPILAKLMDVSVLRAKVHAANLANQNTPGYKAQAVAFDQAFQQALAQGDTGAALGVSPTLYEPRDTPEENDGNDVSPPTEIMQAAQNATLYNAYITMAQGRQKLLSTAISSAPGG